MPPFLATPRARLAGRLGGFVANRHEQCGLAMSMTGEQALQQAISTISQSDPLIKLLQQVRLGRMRSADVGLRAVTESWLGIYGKALTTDGLTRFGLQRLNPAPRLAVLVEVGVLTDEHAGVMALKASYDELLARAPVE